MLIDIPSYPSSLEGNCYQAFQVCIYSVKNAQSCVSDDYISSRTTVKRVTLHKNDTFYSTWKDFGMGQQKEKQIYRMLNRSLSALTVSCSLNFSSFLLLL